MTTVSVVNPQSPHVKQVIEHLERLLVDAKEGKIISLTGIAEYRGHYEDFRSGCNDTYRSIGAHVAAALKIFQDIRSVP